MRRSTGYTKMLHRGEMRLASISGTPAVTQATYLRNFVIIKGLWITQ